MYGCMFDFMLQPRKSDFIDLSKNLLSLTVFLAYCCARPWSETRHNKEHPNIEHHNKEHIKFQLFSLLVSGLTR